MSILDTFFIMFDSNSAAVKQGLDQVTAAGKQTQAELNNTGKAGVNAAHSIEEGNSRLADSFDRVKEHARTMAETLIEHALEVAAAFKAIFEIEKMVDNFFEQADRTEELGNQAKMLGVNVEEMDMWGQAVTRVGGTTEAFSQSLLTLSRGLERVALGTGKAQGGLTAIFKKLGIEIKEANGHVKPAFDLLTELHNKIQNLPKGESAGLLRGLRIDPGTIRLLQQNNKEWDELIARQKELGNITEHDTEVAERFERKWKDVKQLFRNITVESDTAFLPVLGRMLEAVENFVVFLREHKDLVVGFFIALGAAALYAADAFGILDFFIGILLSPITAIVVGIAALIAAFALAYDDIKGFMEGSRSVTGELAKQWPIVGDAVRGFVHVLQWMRDEAFAALSDLYNWIKRIPDGFRQWEEILGGVGSRVQTFIDAVISKFQELPTPIRDVFNSIGVVIKDGLDFFVDIAKLGFQALIAEVRSALQIIGAIFHLLGDLIVDPEHAFQHFWNTVKDIVEQFVGAMPRLTAAFDEVNKAIKQIGDDIIGVFKRIWDAVGWIIDKITAAAHAVAGAVGGGTPGTAGAVDEYGRPQPNVPSGSPSGMLGAPAVPGLMPGQIAAGIAGAAGSNGASGLPGTGALSQGTLPDLSSGQAAIAATQTSLASQTSNSLSAANSNVVVNNNNSIGGITVNGANDPKATADAVHDALQQHYTDVIPNYASGVSH